MSDIDLLFIAYLTKGRKTKTQLAEHLHVSLKTMSAMWKNGVGSWRFDEVIKTANFLNIPIDVLREVITYRKDKKP